MKETDGAADAGGKPCRVVAADPLDLRMIEGLVASQARTSVNEYRTHFRE